MSVGLDPARAALSDDFATQWRIWFDQVEAELTAEYGFLAVTGLVWLSDEPTRIPGVPGRWSATSEHVVVDLAAGERLDDGSTPAGGRRLIRTVDGGLRGETAAVWHGRVQVEIVRKHEGVFVRPRDPDNPRRTGFAGTAVYPPDPRWQLEGAWRPPTSQEPLALASSLPGVVNRYRDAGTLDVEIGGRARRFTLIESRLPGHVRLVFRDGTSGEATYPSGRYLDIWLSEDARATRAASRVRVDFNRARNFPCSYSPAPTCPHAPPGNTVEIPIEAGAQRPRS